jgi:hypothetical protein
VLHKWGGMCGKFDSAGAGRRPLEALRMKIVSTTSEQAEMAYNVHRFEVKKEISVSTFFPPNPERRVR